MLIAPGRYVEAPPPHRHEPSPSLNPSPNASPNPNPSPSPNANPSSSAIPNPSPKPNLYQAAPLLLDRPITLRGDDGGRLGATFLTLTLTLALAPAQP